MGVGVGEVVGGPAPEVGGVLGGEADESEEAGEVVVLGQSGVFGAFAADVAGVAGEGGRVAARGLLGEAGDGQLAEGQIGGAGADAEGEGELAVGSGQEEAVLGLEAVEVGGGGPREWGGEESHLRHEAFPEVPEHGSCDRAGKPGGLNSAVGRCGAHAPQAPTEDGPR